MRKVNTNYDNLSQSKFVEFLNFVIFCLTSNLNFPSLPLTIADFTTLKDDYVDALAKSQAGDHVSTATATAKRGEIDEAITLNGNYINTTAKGDVAKLESSGFTLGKERVFTPKPPVKVLSSAVEGEAKLILHAIDGAICYLVEICADPLPAQGNNSVWQRRKMCKRSYQTLTGIDKNKKYWLKFCYLTIEDEAAYSEPFPFSIT